ncbi:MAG: EamA family transporter RarD [Candidatus Krumholzibacteriia bacterium]
MTAAHETRRGVLYGFLAYGWWGFIALYFRAVQTVMPLEVLAHRIIWSALLLLLLLAARGRLRDLATAVRHRRTLLTLAASTALIAVNWYVFIVAVTTGHLLQASLGYYINPLVNVLLGFVFLGERLRTAQRWSVLLAAVGVAWLGASFREVPVTALVLATSFGLYGLLRKTARADALTGLAFETLLLLPAAALFLGRAHAAERLAFLHREARLDLLLVAAGPITALPLLWFANAARRLRLATVGFLQYLSPSLQFLLAVTVFGERFTPAHRVAFACIWTALAIYTADAVRASRAPARP